MTRIAPKFLEKPVNPPLLTTREEQKGQKRKNCWSTRIGCGEIEDHRRFVTHGPCGTYLDHIRRTPRFNVLDQCCSIVRELA